MFDIIAYFLIFNLSISDTSGMPEDEFMIFLFHFRCEVSKR